MLKQLGTGLVVTRLMGAGRQRHHRRLFSQPPVLGENGEISIRSARSPSPATERHAALNIVSVGSDIETRSNIQCGSVLLPEMKIAGPVILCAVGVWRALSRLSSTNLGFDLPLPMVAVI